MAKRGRKPKPDHLRVLDGTKRADRHPDEVPDPGGTLPVEPPKYLGDVAAEFWSEVRPILHGMGVGTEGDQWSLEAMALMYEDAIEAYKDVQEHGRFYYHDKSETRKKNPALVEMRQALDKLRIWFNEVGLTPAARANLQAGSTKKLDEMEEFLA